MLILATTRQFEKSAKLMKKRGKDLSKLQKVVKTLIEQETLPEKYKDHKLTGNFRDYRECHIEPDWLLIYRITRTHLYLAQTGTHSDLFKK